jgi:chemotaxis protein MotA
MNAILGIVVVILAVFGGYAASGAELSVLVQPFEVLEIIGAAVGSFVIGNPPHVLKSVGKAMGTLIQGSRHNKASYLETFGCLYSLFKLSKSKGDLAMESHVEKPQESSLFQRFPKMLADHHCLDFLCDYLRLLTLGTHNANELETIIDAEIEAHFEEINLVSNAILTMADGMPALGIVAAVLGVIHTMGSITEPPEVLGHLIGGALVGTFMGVLLSYGFVAPIGRSIGIVYKTEEEYLKCIKNCILAYMMGYAPQVCIEFGRKSLPGGVRPSFNELEESIIALPPD